MLSSQAQFSLMGTLSCPVIVRASSTCEHYSERLGYALSARLSLRSREILASAAVLKRPDFTRTKGRILLGEEND